MRARRARGRHVPTATHPLGAFPPPPPPSSHTAAHPPHFPTRPFVETPLLVVNSKFDTWQEVSVVGVDCKANVSKDGDIDLCPPGMAQQEAFWRAYGDTLTARVSALPPRHGAFITNCPVHCQTGARWTDPSTGTVATLGQAVDAWWPDALAHGGQPGWEAPRFIALDADQCVKGPPSRC